MKKRSVLIRKFDDVFYVKKFFHREDAIYASRKGAKTLSWFER